MSAVRSKSSDDPISYDAAAVLATGGIHQVDLDELEHGPMAMRMLDVLCEGHPFRETEALVAAQKALEARLKFWDSVELAL